VNDCGLKPAHFLPEAKRGPFFAAAKKWAASAEANALGGAIFASTKMRPFALERESGSCNGCAPLLPEGKQLPRTRSHSVSPMTEKKD